jgi:hypothetical protein
MMSMLFFADPPHQSNRHPLSLQQQVTDTKYTADVRSMFKEGKEVVGRRPAVIISNGAANFHNAYNKEFFMLKKPRTKHIPHVRLQGDHENKME